MRQEKDPKNDKSMSGLQKIKSESTSTSLSYLPTTRTENTTLFQCIGIDVFGPFNILKYFMRIINVFGSKYTVNCNNVIIAENCMTHDFEDHRNKGWRE